MDFHLLSKGNRCLQLAVFLIKSRSKTIPCFLLLAVNYNKTWNERARRHIKWIYTALAYPFSSSTTRVFSQFNCSSAGGERGGGVEESKQAMSSILIQFVTSSKLSFESCEIKRRKNSVPHNPTAFVVSSASAASSGSLGSTEPRH